MNDMCVHFRRNLLCSDSYSHPIHCNNPHLYHRYLCLWNIHRCLHMMIRFLLMRSRYDTRTKIFRNYQSFLGRTNHCEYNYGIAIMLWFWYANGIMSTHCSTISAWIYSGISYDFINHSNAQRQFVVLIMRGYF